MKKPGHLFNPDEETPLFLREEKPGEWSKSALHTGHFFSSRIIAFFKMTYNVYPILLRLALIGLVVAFRLSIIHIFFSHHRQVGYEGLRYALKWTNDVKQ